MKLYLRAGVFQNFFPGRLPDLSAPENNNVSAMRLLAAGLIYISVHRSSTATWRERWRAKLRISFVSLIIGATGAIAAFFLMPPSAQGSGVADEDDHPRQNIGPFGLVWLDLFSRSSRLFPFAGSFSSMARTLTFSPLLLSATSDCILPISRLSPTGCRSGRIAPSTFTVDSVIPPASISSNGILTNLGFDLRADRRHRATGNGG